MKLRKGLAAAAAASLGISLMVAAPAQANSVTIRGSGASSVANLLLDVCVPGYQRKTGNVVNYRSTGSGTGRREFTQGVVDFAFSDTAYGSSEAQPDNFVYIPAAAFPIAIFANLPGYRGELNLRPDTVAKIYSGQITMWNDRQIVADNNRTIRRPVYKTRMVNGKREIVKNKNGKPVVARVITRTVEANLPALPIRVWYRSDSSGTTGVFMTWLSSTSPSVWDAKVANNGVFSSAYAAAQGRSVPAGTFQGGAQSVGVANGVASIPGSIGYAELSFATERNMKVAAIQNGAGEFVMPSATSAAAYLGDFTSGTRGVVTLNPTTRASGAYSLATFAYALAYTGGKDAARQRTVVDFLNYVLDDCIGAGGDKLGFIKITGALETLIRRQLNEVK